MSDRDAHDRQAKAARIEELEQRCALMHRDVMDLYGRDHALLLRVCERHDAMKARLEAAQTWQPIETAPTNGMPVLVYDEGAIVIASYVEEDGVWHDNGPMSPAPSHWMPLPAPPLEPQP